jgi:hypothetical protein
MCVLKLILRKMVGMFRNVIRYFFLLLFLCYWGSIALFQHTHVVKNYIITHSHPYKTKNHEHSNEELQILQALTEYATTLTISLVLFFVFQSIDPFITAKKVFFKTTNLAQFNFLLRAPPLRFF